MPLFQLVDPESLLLQQTIGLLEGSEQNISVWVGVLRNGDVHVLVGDHVLVFIPARVPIEEEAGRPSLESASSVLEGGRELTTVCSSRVG